MRKAPRFRGRLLTCWIFSERIFGMAVPLRNVRVPDELWEAAMTKAGTEGRTLTYVINTALRNYVSTPPQILVIEADPSGSGT